MTEQAFEDLVRRARSLKMTASEKEAQRRSFAFGNANIENEAVTREVVERVADELASGRDPRELYLGEKRSVHRR
jgi:hypothetical protein